MGDPATLFPENFTAVLKSLRLKLYHLLADAFDSKKSIEKSVISAIGTSPVDAGTRMVRDALHSAGHLRRYQSAKAIRLK